MDIHSPHTSENIFKLILFNLISELHSRPHVVIAGAVTADFHISHTNYFAYPQCNAMYGCNAMDSTWHHYHYSHQKKKKQTNQFFFAIQVQIWKHSPFPSTPTFTPTPKPSPSPAPTPNLPPSPPVPWVQGSLPGGTLLAVGAVVGGAGAASVALWYYSSRWKPWTWTLNPKSHTLNPNLWSLFSTPWTRKEGKVENEHALWPVNSNRKSFCYESMWINLWPETSHTKLQTLRLYSHWQT